MNEYTTINKYGTKSYYKDKARTIRHREDGPAIEYHNGSKSWYLNGKLHRMDGPAYETVDGFKSWFIKDKRHRVGGPAFATADGYKEWWVDGEFIFSVNEQNNIINRMK